MASEVPASILLIDDDGPFARSMQILLEDEGYYNVDVAGSAYHALAALKAGQRFDILIIDLAIFETHGAQLSREIENHNLWPAVIVMTAHEAALDAAHSGRIDAYGFLAKPIDPGALLTMVHTAPRDKQAKRDSIPN